MASLKESMANPAYRFGSITIFLFFAAWGIWWSFFQIWLTSKSVGLQLSGSQVGTIYSINGAVTLVLMLLYGTMQDRLGLKRTLILVVSFLAALIGPFVNFVYRPMLESNFYLAAIIGGVVLSAGFVAACGLYEAFVERLSRKHNFEFGQARMWGSFGYAVVALAAGFLFTINPALNFWMGSALGLVLFLVQLLWRTESSVEGQAQGITETTTPSVGEMLGLLKNSHVWIVIGFVLLSWTFYTVFDQQMFPDFYTSLFASAEDGQRAYGTLNSIQVFVEAIMMGLIPVLMNRIGAHKTLVLGGVVMFFRILMCGLFDGPILISAAKMLHAVEVPLFVLAMFKYFSIHFNKGLSATLYLVAFNLAAQLGTVILSTPLGTLRDSIGYQSTFHVIAGVVFVAILIARFLLKPDDKDVYIQPDETAVTIDKEDVEIR